MRFDILKKFRGSTKKMLIVQNCLPFVQKFIFFGLVFRGESLSWSRSVSHWVCRSDRISKLSRLGTLTVLKSPTQSYIVLKSPEKFCKVLPTHIGRPVSQSICNILTNKLSLSPQRPAMSYKVLKSSSKSSKVLQSPSNSQSPAKSFKELQRLVKLQSPLKYWKSCESPTKLL